MDLAPLSAGRAVDPIAHFYAVIPAGGAGTRLWPLSRRAQPKFLLDLDGSGRSLLQSTWDRLQPLAEGILVVTGGNQALAVSRQLPDLREDNLLVEPLPRDSAAAIGLAAAVLMQRDPEAIMGSFAADHVITQTPVFHDAIAQAVAAAGTGLLVTVGMKPSFPATGFGYIRAGAQLALSQAPDAYAVREFVEKPTAEVAAEYFAAGYRWNAGIFVARAATVMQLLGDYRPQLAADLWQIAMAWDSPRRAEVLEQLWPHLERVAVDYAIAEPAAADGRVAMIPGDFGWDDVGDFAALSGVLPAAPVQTLGPAEVLALHSSGVVISTNDKLIAVLGVDDIVVVDTPDALLITSRARAQSVKSIVDELADRPEVL